MYVSASAPGRYMDSHQPNPPCRFPSWPCYRPGTTASQASLPSPAVSFLGEADKSSPTTSLRPRGMKSCRVWGLTTVTGRAATTLRVVRVYCMCLRTVRARELCVCLWCVCANAMCARGNRAHCMCCVCMWALGTCVGVRVYCLCAHMHVHCV